MSPVVFGLFGVGAAFTARPLCHLSRLVGAALIGAGMLLVAAPAFAQDETLIARDNSEVACTVSLKGLTRVSLKNDRFASVSKLTRGLESDDFTVVNEPTRGDIYISLPDGYTRGGISFFGTTSKGYVYKFACRAAGEDAHQVFVENRELLADPTPLAPAAPADTAIALVQAMYASRVMDGFELHQVDLRPVAIGDLRVRMIAEYRGSDLSGRVLHIENAGKRQVSLDDRVIAPANAVAVSVAQPLLMPGQATSAFVVLPAVADR